MGLLSKIFNSSEAPKKGAKQKVVKNGDWEVHIREDGTPHWFYKSGREWFSADETWASPSKSFFLHMGFDGAGNSGLALTTKDEGLKRKATEYGVDAALVLEDGTAYALSVDDAVLYILTPEKISQKTLGDERADAFLLTSRICIIATEGDDSVTIKAIDLSTGKSWRKSVGHGEAEELQDGSLRMTQISESVEGIKVITPDGLPHFFSTNGQPIKN